MDNLDKTVIVAIISAAVAIVVAIISAAATTGIKIWGDYNTKKQEREDARAAEKLNHYKVFLSSLSGMATDNSNQEFADNFALASNTIALVAPQKVVNALMNFVDAKKCVGEPDPRVLVKLILEIRKDIGIGNDDEQTFRYELVKWDASEKAKKLS
ncbi:MAG: hypothetical protein P4L91_09910 [Burkholderiaceae bacterium]|nr:hypothetical protein [Burkholderiaceae bacterium]